MASSFFGTAMGLSLGGYLADPGERFPQLGEWRLTQARPFALPGIALSFMYVLTFKLEDGQLTVSRSLLCIVVVWLVVPEVRSHCPCPADDRPIRGRVVPISHLHLHAYPPISATATSSRKVSSFSFFRSISVRISRLFACIKDRG